MENLEWQPNPHRGTTTFQRFNGQALYPGLSWNDREGPVEFPPPPKSPADLINPRYPNTTVSYCRWIWRVLEPKRGEYQWQIIDGALKAAQQRGQTLQLRLQPYADDDLPDWLWNEGVKVHEVVNNRREPDCNDPIYIKNWVRFITAFGKRYNGHPDLESVDVVHGGQWGEGGGNSTYKSAKPMVDAFVNSFTKTTLVSMYNTQAIRYGTTLKRPMGWRCDCIGDLRMKSKVPHIVPDGLIWNHMFDYPKWLVKDGVSEAWRVAPVTLETCWVVGFWRKEHWNIDWIIDQMLKYHATFFMPKSCYFPIAWKNKMDAFNRKLGYRFVLRQVVTPTKIAPGARFNLEFWVDNDGVAPLYRPYKLALRFRQGSRSEVVLMKQDPRTWMPGQNWFEEAVKLPSFIKPGTFEMDAGIVDEKTKRLRVQFCVQGNDKEGWFPMFAQPNRSGDPGCVI